MQPPAQPLSTAAIDQLGERLRLADSENSISEADLRCLDQYRHEFTSDHELVLRILCHDLQLPVSGRSAKSTNSIIEKLKRGSMRLSQMQDIAGCRVVVADIHSQDGIVRLLAHRFPSTVVDRRQNPSHGYRAVHVVVRPGKRPIEIQVRTVLQHLWAEFSEKSADAYGIELKYGGGDKTFREDLDQSSKLVAVFEKLEPDVEIHGDRLTELRTKVGSHLQGLIAQLEGRS